MPSPFFRWGQVSDASQPELFPPVTRRVGKGEYRGLEFLEVEAKRLINEIPPAARLPFRYTINAYRGCSHACVYCFARPTHEYLDLDRGRDFETKIVVKVNAVERVRAETAPGRWAGESIAMGTNTDPYQPAEGKYRLTRGIIGVLVERANPFSILTKSTLALRDVELFVEAAERTAVRVDFSVGTLDEDTWRLTEPGTPHPRRRLDAVAKLNEAGIRSGVLVAPILPGLSDRPEQIEAVVIAAREAGARVIHPMLLHLKPGVREHYLGWLTERRPDLVPLHLERYRDRSYARPDDQRVVAETAERALGRTGERTARRPGGTPPETRRRSAPEAAQLDLGV